ncbi:hypothetical protein CVAR21S_01571 [Corynebacterium variabile]
MASRTARTIAASSSSSPAVTAMTPPAVSGPAPTTKRRPGTLSCRVAATAATLSRSGPMTDTTVGTADALTVFTGASPSPGVPAGSSDSAGPKSRRCFPCAAVLGRDAAGSSENSRSPRRNRIPPEPPTAVGRSRPSLTTVAIIRDWVVSASVASASPTIRSTPGTRTGPTSAASSTRTPSPPTTRSSTSTTGSDALATTRSSRSAPAPAPPPRRWPRWSPSTTSSPWRSTAPAWRSCSARWCAAASPTSAWSRVTAWRSCSACSPPAASPGCACTSRTRGPRPATTSVGSSKPARYTWSARLKPGGSTSPPTTPTTRSGSTSWSTWRTTSSTLAGRMTLPFVGDRNGAGPRQSSRVRGRGPRQGGHLIHKYL